MSQEKHAGKEESSDPRFANVHSDPKFRETKAKKFKIKLDDRFSKKDLQFKRKARVDKYGRSLKGQENKDKKDFDKYYEKDDKKKEDKVKPDDEEKSDSEAESANEAKDIGDSAAVKPVSLDRARGEVPSDYVSSSEDESSSESEAGSEDSDIESEESEVEIEDTKPQSGDSSKTCLLYTSRCV